MLVIDVLNPTSPQEVGYTYTPGSCVNLVVVGAHADCADIAGLTVVNVATLSDPEVQSCHFTPAVTRSVALDSVYAVLANDWAGVRVLDISNPAHLEEVGSCVFTGAANTIALAGNYAYVAALYGGFSGD